MSSLTGEVSLKVKIRAHDKLHTLRFSGPFMWQVKACDSCESPFACCSLGALKTLSSTGQNLKMERSAAVLLDTLVKSKLGGWAVCPFRCFK